VIISYNAWEALGDAAHLQVSHWAPATAKAWLSHL
jgi:hypothetical protein